MNITKFTRLPKDEKTNYLWDYGVCLGQRLIGEHEIVCLFELDAFYVEAVYSRENNCVDEISPLLELPQWDAYVDLMLLELLNL
jgi:hypothetical protein